MSNALSAPSLFLFLGEQYQCEQMQPELAPVSQRLDNERKQPAEEEQTER